MANVTFVERLDFQDNGPGLMVTAARTYEIIVWEPAGRIADYGMKPAARRNSSKGAGLSWKFCGLLMLVMGCTAFRDQDPPDVSRLVRADQEQQLRFRSGASSRFAKRIVVLGDSLSDLGRLRERLKIFYPPTVYWQARASNGPLWIDYVRKALDAKIKVYAVAGATTGDNSWFRSLLIPSVQNQLDEYLDDTQRATRSQDLLVFWIGPNNYLKDPDTGDVEQALQDIEEVLNKAYAEGVRTLAVGTMPELGGLPAYQDAPLQDEKLRDSTRAHNRGLKALLERFSQQHADAVLVTFQAAAINQETIERPRDFGFRNITQACYRGDYLGRYKTESAFCAEPSAVKFWDEVHPNSKMHCYYAAQFLADLMEGGLMEGYSRAEAVERCKRL